ncbi:Na-translocating system protein MpsC family protein [Sinobaca sp. H24]|uniref:Na-translocating system protein MpsC family protein n=1 Tax=Sinobaca sp. H24 TaxID=2923376 RepID=UPI002079FD0D|nr:Na-translocating system protein MpsC family protein [Sinobaca sp. H24]
MSAYNEMDEKALRKEIAQIYNKVNQEMYKVGVRKQKIEILQDKILVFGEHQRVPALEAIHEKYPELTLTVDTTLIKEFKERLKMELEKELSIKVKTILKDFDPVTEEAAAIIYIAV